MKIDVYNTYATHAGSEVMHFDVLLPAGESRQQAIDSAILWLEEVGIEPGSIRLDQCNYCHSEIAAPEIENALDSKGFAILQLEGCPAPIY